MKRKELMEIRSVVLEAELYLASTNKRLFIKYIDKWLENILQSPNCYRGVKPFKYDL